MVLENLGSSLKSTLGKIRDAMFVDEKLINELVKDIQRALLQSDCNVKLVFELTKQIKEKALKEEPPSGMNKKEWLIKIVYDELVRFLGQEEGVIEIGDKKPFKLLLVGLFGNGKCVHENSNILLEGGETVAIKKLYDSYKRRGEYKLEDGFIIPLDDEVFVPSLNPKTLTLEKKRVSYLWKLRSKQLLDVCLDNGNHFDVKTTSEHPFFIMKDGFVQQKRADELKKGDYVAVPANCTHEVKHWCLRDQLCDLDLDVLLTEDETEEVKSLVKERYGSLKNALKKIALERNYVKFTLSFAKGQVPLCFCQPIQRDKLRIKHRTAQVFVDFPMRLTPELAELIGYVVGDGYLSKRSVHVSTADQETIDRVKELSKSLFSLECSVTKDKRTDRTVSLRINSSTLVEVFHVVFGIPIGKKGRRLEIPLAIQQSSLDAVASFLRAYFDCDAYFSPKQRQIEVSSESEILIKQLQHMLLRFHILGVRTRKKAKGEWYYLLVLRSTHALFFSEKIGSRIKRKQKALASYLSITQKQGDGKQDMIPVGNLLKRVRNSLGCSLGQIQREVASYGLYERKGLISRSKLKDVLAFYDAGNDGNAAKVMNLVLNKEVGKVKEDLSQGLFNALVFELKRKDLVAEVTNSPTKFVLSQKGKEYLADVGDETSQTLLTQLRYLAYSDLSWIGVKSVKRIKNDSSFVYDLTVEDNHNFIAEGVVVHNTTTAGKLAKFYVKRGIKVALMSTDTWRPAAFEQLRQIGSQINVPVFGNPKAKHPRDIYKEFEKELSNYDLVIIDTAGRDALNDELIEELNDINKTMEADETLLVIGADVGQAAEKQAHAFHETCHVTGVIITKLDGTAKGGGALIACSVTGAKVMFIGLGEKIDDLEKFKPVNFVGRLLGMGDLDSLLEKAKGAITEEEAQDMGKKFLEGKFTLLDLYEQMEAMSKMGPLGKVMELVPGMSQLQLPKDMVSIQEGKLKIWKFIMNSCTKHELENPDEIDRSRIDRIAKGSGTNVGDVRDLLKQYKQSKKMVKTFKGMGAGSPKAMEKMMKRMGGMKGMAGMKPK